MSARQDSPLHRSFSELSAYQASEYRLLPFRFQRFDAERYVLTNLAGEYQLLPRNELDALVNHRLTPNCDLYDSLKAAHFLADTDSQVSLDLLAAQYRTRAARLPNFTSLHLFVVTLRCDHSCQYCQVSRVSQDRVAFDMTRETADRAIRLMLRSPSDELKVEFQGGEPLLNFDLIRHIVTEVERLIDGRTVQFVITSNLSQLNDHVLEFARRHNIFFSTSIDGPADLHDRNRPRPGSDSYARAAAGIAKIRQHIGPDSVAALMTATAESLTQPERIIDDYVRLGFTSIFLRFISPYGFAMRSAARIGYDTEAFIQFFKRGLSHIISLNQQGIPLRETYSSLLLQRILTPYPTGYVDLQSPAGAGISVLAYNFDGKVYASDEGRMLAEMNDERFCLGTVFDDYEHIISNSGLLQVIHDTMLEGTPGCCDCAFLPYCGSDPVFHYRTQGDVVAHQPTSSFCRRNMEIIRHLIMLLEDDAAAADVLRSWI